MKTIASSCVFLYLSIPVWGQAQKSEPVPIYRVTVVGRTAKAVNYGHRSGPTKIDFRGTVLIPEARGEATVVSRQGAVAIDAKFEKLEPPTRFGREYLTYVLWAITPDGRATNLGELVTDDANKSRLRTSSELQAFGLLVTAEPYYSVTQPSDVVVMENALRKDTIGKVEEIDAKYELLPRGHYTYQAQPPGYNTAANGGKKVSLNEYEALVELYQARNAVQIAAAAGADRYAGDTFRKAQQLLQDAESYHASRSAKKTVVMTARQAAQTAEDARIITLRKLEEERQENQRRSAVNTRTP